MKLTQQSLFPSLPVPEPASVSAVRRRLPRQARPVLLPRRLPLWLAVHLPAFSLEARLRGQSAKAPQAIIVSAGTVRVHAVDARARDAGVRPGMTLATAWSLLPGLEVHERDCHRERQLLLRLAGWARRFTPTVCIDDEALLLEVRGSLRLFNGVEALRECVSGGLRQLGFTANCAQAPTPRAALWLSRAGIDSHIDEVDRLSGALGRLPLSAAGFDAALLERFHGIGARRISDLLRLPRDGFARRYSARVLRELDQALGRVADVRRPVPVAKTFATRIDLLYEISEAQHLLPPVQHLLHELDGYLTATQQGVSRLQLKLFHREETFTPVMLGFSEATRDPERIRDLVEQKFETIELPAPVVEIGLQAAEMTSLAARDRTLFVEQRDDGDWPRLVERLTTRLGTDAVHSVEEQEDHRPERAWRFVPPGEVRELAGQAGQPCWLLDSPKVLHVRDGRPVSDGPLEILSGPERIEAGWWDEADTVRDYYVARDIHGRRLWICKEAGSTHWWLQGFFG